MTIDRHRHLLMPITEKKTEVDNVHKWAAKQGMDVQVVRDIIRKKGKKKLSSPRIRFVGPSLNRI